MKKLNRVVSAIVLVAFLCNSFLLNPAFAQGDLNSTCNSSTLGIALKTGSILGPEAEDINKIVIGYKAWADLIKKHNLPVVDANLKNTKVLSDGTLRSLFPGFRVYRSKIITAENTTIIELKKRGEDVWYIIEVTPGQPIEAKIYLKTKVTSTQSPAAAVDIVKIATNLSDMYLPLPAYINELQEEIRHIEGLLKTNNNITLNDVLSLGLLRLQDNKVLPKELEGQEYKDVIISKEAAQNCVAIYNKLIEILKSDKQAPTAATAEKSVTLTHLADHRMLNALLEMFFEAWESGKYQEELAKFVEFEEGNNIYWFSGPKHTFLDIFNKLVKLNGGKEDPVVNELCKRSGIKESAEILKEQFDDQISHIGIERNVKYASSPCAFANSSERDIYRDKILLPHEAMEQAIHKQVIDEVFGGHAYIYRYWRDGILNKNYSNLCYVPTRYIFNTSPKETVVYLQHGDNHESILINIHIGSGKNIKGYFTYNEFAELAYRIAQARYPCNLHGQQTKLETVQNRKGFIAPTAAVASEPSSSVIFTAAKEIANLYKPSQDYIEELEKQILQMGHSLDKRMLVNIGELPALGRLVLKDHAIIRQELGDTGSYEFLTRTEAIACINVFDKVVRILKTQAKQAPTATKRPPTAAVTGKKSPSKQATTAVVDITTPAMKDARGILVNLRDTIAAIVIPGSTLLDNPENEALLKSANNALEAFDRGDIAAVTKAFEKNLDDIYKRMHSKYATKFDILLLSKKAELIGVPLLNFQSLVSKASGNKEAPKAAERPADLMLPSEGTMTGIGNFTIGQFIKTFVPKAEQEKISEKVVKVLRDSFNIEKKEDAVNRPQLLDYNFNQLMLESSNGSDSGLYKKEAGYKIRQILINPIIARANPDKYGVVKIPDDLDVGYSMDKLWQWNPNAESLFKLLYFVVGDGSEYREKLNDFYSKLSELIWPAAVSDLGTKQKLMLDLRHEFKEHLLRSFAAGSVTVVDYEKALEGTPVLEARILTDMYKKPFLGKLGFTSGKIRIMSNPKITNSNFALQRELQQALAEEELIHFLHTQARGVFPHDTINKLSNMLIDAARLSDFTTSNLIMLAERINEKEVEISKSGPITMNNVTNEKPLDLLLPSEGVSAAKPTAAAAGETVIPQAVIDFTQELADSGYKISQDGFAGLGDFVPDPAKGRNFTIFDLIGAKIVRAVTTNNSIMCNILKSMHETKLDEEQFKKRFLVDRGADISLKDLNLNLLVGRILKTIEKNQDLMEPSRKDELLRKVYNDINEKDVASPPGAALENIWRETNHRDGYISVEPFTDTVEYGDVEKIVKEAIGKFERIQEEIKKLTGSTLRNIHIKLPVTPAGLEAGKILLSKGYNINFTLIATAEQYKEVIKAYKAGIKKFVENIWNKIVVNGDQTISIEKRIEQFKKEAVEFIAQSVASIFVSRDDRNVYAIINDKTFGEMIKHLHFRFNHRKNVYEGNEIAGKLYLYRAIAPGATQSDIDDLSAYDKHAYSAEELSKIREEILKAFDDLKVKDAQGNEIVGLTQAGVSFMKSVIRPIYEQEFEKDKDWLDFVKQYDLPAELLSQQLYPASTGVKVGKEYTTNAFYLEQLSGSNETNTIPYPVIYAMVKEGKALFKPAININKGLETAKKVLYDLYVKIGIGLNLIKQEIIFKEGIVTFGNDDKASLALIGEDLPAAMEIKKRLDASNVPGKPQSIISQKEQDETIKSLIQEVVKTKGLYRFINSIEKAGKYWIGIGNQMTIWVFDKEGEVLVGKIDAGRGYSIQGTLLSVNSSKNGTSFWNLETGAMISSEEAAKYILGSAENKVPTAQPPEGKELVVTPAVATQVGTQIMDEAKQPFTLLVPHEFLSDKELESDTTKFGDGIGIERVDGFGTSMDSYLNNLPSRVKNPSTTIALVPQGTTESQIAVLQKECPGIRVLPADEKAMDLRTINDANLRANFRTDTYALMVLARGIKEGDKNSDIYNILKLYVKDRIAFKDGASVAPEAYIEAIVKNELGVLLNGWVKPADKLTIEEDKLTLSEPLLSA